MLGVAHYQNVLLRPMLDEMRQKIPTSPSSRMATRRKRLSGSWPMMAVNSLHQTNFSTFLFKSIWTGAAKSPNQISHAIEWLSFHMLHDFSFMMKSRIFFSIGIPCVQLFFRDNFDWPAVAAKPKPQIKWNFTHIKRNNEASSCFLFHRIWFRR